MIDAQELLEALQEAKTQFEQAAQENLDIHLEQGDLAGIKYAAGQLRGMRVFSVRVLGEIKRLREDADG